MSKMLIVYYSQARGNTRRIAQMLQEATGADMAEIQTVHEYEGSYEDIVNQGQDEVNSGFMPEIKPLGVNIDDYDVIAIGTPTWWYTMAPAVLTFLSSQKFSGKTIIPFSTHGGWPGHLIRDIKSVCKDATFRCEKEIQFDSTGGDTLVMPVGEIETWIDDIKNI